MNTHVTVKPPVPVLTKFTKENAQKYVSGIADNLERVSDASLLFSGSVPLISYRPVLWPLHAFGLKLRKKS
jgi:hypothetical protein